MLLNEENYEGLMMEQNKFVDNIKDRIDKEIHIKRVPRHAKRWFIDYANDKFEGDYGMLLKHIIDMYRGMTPVGYDEIQAQITELRSELEMVKGLMSKPEEEKNVKVMADGTERRVN